MSCVSEHKSCRVKVNLGSVYVYNCYINRTGTDSSLFFPSGLVISLKTYNRESIQKWLDTNHRTCPKTRQTLAHLSLAPNYALKNLIMQWCEKTKFQLPKKETSTGQENSSTEHKEEISSLVDQLPSSHLEVQRNAAMKIRLISKEKRTEF